MGHHRSLENHVQQRNGIPAWITHCHFTCCLCCSACCQVSGWTELLLPQWRRSLRRRSMFSRRRSMLCSAWTTASATWTMPTTMPDILVLIGTGEAIATVRSTARRTTRRLVAKQFKTVPMAPGAVTRTGYRDVAATAVVPSFWTFPQLEHQS